MLSHVDGEGWVTCPSSHKDDLKTWRKRATKQSSLCFRSLQRIKEEEFEEDHATSLTPNGPSPSTSGHCTCPVSGTPPLSVKLSYTALSAGNRTAPWRGPSPQRPRRTGWAAAACVSMAAHGPGGTGETKAWVVVLLIRTTKEEAYNTLVFCLTAPIQPGWDKRGKWPTVIQLPKPATPSSFFTLQRSYTLWAALRWTVFRSQLKLDFLPHSFTLSEGFFFSLGERKATLLFHVLQAWVWVDHTAYEHCFSQHLTENSSWPHRGRSQSAFFFWFTVQSQVLPKYSGAGDVNCFLFHFTFF